MPDSRAELAEAGEVAATAMESFTEDLEILVRDGRGELRARRGALHGAAQGEGAARLRSAQSCASEARRRGPRSTSRCRRLLAEVDPSADGWRSVVESLNDDHPSSPEEMLETYTDWTERARRFLVGQRPRHSS